MSSRDLPLAIVGPRRSGKTTRLLKWGAQQSNRIVLFASASHRQYAAGMARSILSQQEADSLIPRMQTVSQWKGVNGDHSMEVGVDELPFVNFEGYPDAFTASAHYEPATQLDDVLQVTFGFEEV